MPARAIDDPNDRATMRAVANVVSPENDREPLAVENPARRALPLLHEKPLSVDPENAREY
jgi:hypothetical protein